MELVEMKSLGVEVLLEEVLENGYMISLNLLVEGFLHGGIIGRV
jgi:hypothetical protein